MTEAGDGPFEADMAERRRTRRARVALACTLRRAAGSPIWAETIDIGERGMCVRATRPLRPDELVEFDLERSADAHLTGSARVMRHQAPRVYGLRFERLPAPMREQLLELLR
jgi:hypothetical protein